MQGTRPILSFRAAMTRVCPQTIVRSLSMTTGTLKPNSRMDAATFSTAGLFLRGFLS